MVEITDYSVSYNKENKTLKYYIEKLNQVNVCY